MSKAKHPTIDRTHVTPKIACEMIGIGIETLLGWIHSGELKSANVSNSSIRPRWRIAKTDLADFLNRRSNQQAGHDAPVKRRPKPRREFV